MAHELLMHYAIPSENLPELAQVGVAKIAIFAFRCRDCGEDFHIDQKPSFCPECGVKFDFVSEFGAAVRQEGKGGKTVRRVAAHL